MEYPKAIVYILAGKILQYLLGKEKMFCEFPKLKRNFHRKDQITLEVALHWLEMQGVIKLWMETPSGKVHKVKYCMIDTQETLKFL